MIPGRAAPIRTPCRATPATAPCWRHRWTGDCSLRERRHRRISSRRRMAHGTAASGRQGKCCRRSRRPRIWLHSWLAQGNPTGLSSHPLVTLQVAMAKEPKERRNWTNDELDLIVADYFAMLNDEAVGK